MGPLWLAALAACEDTGEVPLPVYPTGGAPITGSDSGDTGIPAVWRLSTCPPNPPTDTLEIDPATQITFEDDLLYVRYDYPCGCAPHTQGGCWGSAFREGSPPTIDLWILHDAHGEACVEACDGGVGLNLALLRDQYRETYGTEHGEVVVEVAWYGEGGVQTQLAPYAW